MAPGDRLGAGGWGHASFCPDVYPDAPLCVQVNPNRPGPWGVQGGADNLENLKEQLQETLTGIGGLSWVVTLLRQERRRRDPASEMQALGLSWH